jgi:hypothetical protein
MKNAGRTTLALISTAGLFLLNAAPQEYETAIAGWCGEIGWDCPAFVKEPSWGWSLAVLFVCALAFALYDPLRKLVFRIRALVTPAPSPVSGSAVSAWLLSALDAARALYNGADVELRRRLQTRIKAAGLSMVGGRDGVLLNRIMAAAHDGVVQLLGRRGVGYDLEAIPIEELEHQYLHTDNTVSRFGARADGDDTRLKLHPPNWSDVHVPADALDAVRQHAKRGFNIATR